MGTYYRERLGGPILQDYAAYFWLREALKSSSRLFDFGGHVGIAYHASRRHLALPDGFVWQVCDLPSIVEAGTALARELDSEHLRFTTDPDEARGADVIYASGSLQYMEEGFLHGLIERVGERASHLIVQSTPLHPERSFVTLQATGHAFCPYTVAQRGSFVEGLQRLGFRLVDEWRIPRELEVPFHDGYRLDAYSGLYFTRA